jgi:hypothetical protein
VVDFKVAKSLLSKKRQELRVFILLVFCQHHDIVLNYVVCVFIAIPMPKLLRTDAEVVDNGYAAVGEVHAVELC